MQTKYLVEFLRATANRYPDDLTMTADLVREAADLLERYEAERCHGEATVRLFDIREIQKQARLLSDAQEIFENSGSLNARMWREHVGKVSQEWFKKHGKPDDPNPGKTTMDMRGEMLIHE